MEIDKKPITIDYLDGCGYSMEINGVEFSELNNEDKKEVCHRIISHSDISEATMQRFIETFLECDANIEPKDLGYCEDCGSYNYEYIINI